MRKLGHILDRDQFLDLDFLDCKLELCLKVVTFLATEDFFENMGHFMESKDILEGD